MEHGMFLAKVNWYNDYAEKEQLDHVIFPADTYAEAAEYLVNAYGADALTDMYLFRIDTFAPIDLSESTYNRFMREDIV